MSDINFLEKRSLEKLLQMSSGYLLNFSNNTFAEFVAEAVSIDPYSAKYDFAGSSKASRLRGIWQSEPNHVVGKLLTMLLDYERDHLSYSDVDDTLRAQCRKVAGRLLQGANVEDVAALTPNTDDRDFEALASEIRAILDRNTPENGLDRLHTFVVEYMRVLHQKHFGAKPDRDKPLHSLVGEYIKILKQKGMIQSDMTERILKSSISVMEAFNNVRNEQSLAHDNPALLSHSEALLIFNNVASAIRFIKVLEENNQLERSGAHI